MYQPPPIESFWEEADFNPNPQQYQAIKHIGEPLYLTAGPGSGKTRVLLWRTMNLIVYHDISPDEIFLATFTEKAAIQLRNGLRLLLGMVSNKTGQSYDLGRMYVGTIHSLCQRMLSDRNFTPDRTRQTPVRLLDELSQYFFLMNSGNWYDLISHLEVANDAAAEHINALFSSTSSVSKSKHHAVTNCISLFNRMAEENLDPREAKRLWERKKEEYDDPERMGELIDLYEIYRKMLHRNNQLELTDFSFLQVKAFELLKENPESEQVFKHIIVDEYQDTNAIQEQIIFKLSQGHKNICVVGDDDQALYRFRGATVENFVQFPDRCQQYLRIKPRRISLVKNYRSRSEIVDFYNEFMEKCQWTQANTSYRVDKRIEPHRVDSAKSVLMSSYAGKPEDSYSEIAAFVKRMLDEGKIQDPNQVAYLFSSLKSVQVERAKKALEQVGLQVYAPRAGRFLEVEESVDMFGLFVQVFGKPEKGPYGGRDYDGFFDWIDVIEKRGQHLMQGDMELKKFVGARRYDLEQAQKDYKALHRVVEKNGWDLQQPYDISMMKRKLYDATGLSDQGKRSLGNRNFENSIRSRQKRGLPLLTLDYALKRSTSIEWNILDLFYRLSGFEHFKAMYDLAEEGTDEGPICNLGLITQYLSRFMDEYLSLIPANMLLDGRYVRLFFISYLYALFRRSESEYEDANDPFPKGRVPFLTIHQSKGLEFPVVVLGNLYKQNRGLQRVEQLVRPLLERESEPADRSTEFDIMRLFYVALSRARNLLVLPRYKRQLRIEPFKALMDNVTLISQFDLSTLPEAEQNDDSLPRSFSFTSDYLLYQRCARQYMVFRKYGFVASRSQTMFFGSLVHMTLEDLHHYLIHQRETNA